MCVENTKEWIEGVIDAEDNGTEGVGDKLIFLVKLIQIILEGVL